MFNQSIVAGANGVSGVSVRRVVVLGFGRELAQRQLWSLLMELVLVDKKTDSHVKFGPIFVNHFQVLSQFYTKIYCT